MSGSATNWYDPNLFAPGNFDTNQGNMGYGTVDNLGDFAKAIGSGLSTVLGGPLGIVNLGAAAATGQAPSTGNTMSAARGALADILGLGGGSVSSSIERDAVGSSVGPGTQEEGDPVGDQERSDDPVGKGGYAEGGPVESGDPLQGILAHALAIADAVRAMQGGALQPYLGQEGA